MCTLTAIFAHKRSNQKIAKIGRQTDKERRKLHAVVGFFEVSTNGKMCAVLKKRKTNYMSTWSGLVIMPI